MCAHVKQNLGVQCALLVVGGPARLRTTLADCQGVKPLTRFVELLECIHKVPSLSYARTARTEVGAHSRSGAPRGEICRSGVTVVATPQSTPAGASARGELGLADGEPPIVRRMPGVGRGRPAPGGEVTAGGERVDDGRSASVRMPDALLALSAVTSIAPKGLRLRAGAKPGLATVGKGCRRGLSVRNGTCKRVSEARIPVGSVELQ
jgi:hypothetical protein